MVPFITDDVIEFFYSIHNNPFLFAISVETLLFFIANNYYEWVYKE